MWFKSNYYRAYHNLVNQSQEMDTPQSEDLFTVIEREKFATGYYVNNGTTLYIHNDIQTYEEFLLLFTKNKSAKHKASVDFKSKKRTILNTHLR